MSFRLNWRGDQVLAAVRAAELAAIDETTETCARQVASQRSGRTGAITSEPATQSGDMTTGRWGLFPEPRGGDAFHELFIETGTAQHPGDNAKRNAADEHYSQLAGRIRSRLNTR